MNFRTRCSCLAWIVAVVGNLVFTPPMLFALPFSRGIELTASNGTEYDYFGVSVGISGDTAIIGAHFDDGAGINSGAAYVFDATTSMQTAKLIASDAKWQDRFGYSVDIDDKTVIVGALTHGHSGKVDAGAAYLFDVTSGDQLFELIATDAEEGDLFGYSVAISSETAIVGSVRSDQMRRKDAGAAYLFNVVTGTQLFKLTPSDVAPDDLFGYSVDISGNTAIVGATQTYVGTGYAYLYDVTTGSQLFKLAASDAGDNDNFGTAVAISSNTVIVGSPGNDEKGNNAGAAYLFDVTTGKQLHKLTSSDIEREDLFGSSVAISGNLAIVGVPMDDDLGGFSGSAYVFDVTTGEQLAKLIALDPVTGDEFGRSVAISGTKAIVGAWQHYHYDSAGVRHGGSAYLFVPEPSVWFLGAIGSIPCVRRRRRG